MKNLITVAAAVSMSCLVACGGGSDPCTQAATDLANVIAECSGEEIEVVEGAEAVAVECTEELQTTNECYLACAQDASCDVLTGSGDVADEDYLADLTAYGDCAAACM